MVALEYYSKQPKNTFKSEFNKWENEFPHNRKLLPTSYELSIYSVNFRSII